MGNQKPQITEKTDNTMTKRKMTKTNNYVQNTTQKTKDRAKRTPQKRERTLLFRKGKQFPLHIVYLSYYFCYKQPLEKTDVAIMYVDIVEWTTHTSY